MKILVIDIGGTNVKVLATGHSERLKIPSGPKMTPKKMVAAVKKAAAGWQYEAVSIGYPGFVLDGRVICDPANLGIGWVGFDFKAAFSRPVKIINDAAMQALGSDEGGRMLFLGLGTGFGCAMVISGIAEGLEIAHLPYKKGKSHEDCVGAPALKRLGKKKWCANVLDIVDQLRAAVEADYVVIGGGNAAVLKKLPRNTRLGDNSKAFIGGYRLWGQSSEPVVQAVKVRGGGKRRDLPAIARGEQSTRH